MSLCPRPESSGNALNTIRLLVAESHPAVRKGLVGLLNMIEGFEVAAEAVDGWDAIGQFHNTSPDVILIGLHLPQFSSVELIEHIRRQAPQTSIVVLSTYDFDEDIPRALDAGANAFLLAGMTIDELATTIRQVHAAHRAQSLSVGRQEFQSEDSCATLRNLNHHKSRSHRLGFVVALCRSPMHW